MAEQLTYDSYTVGWICVLPLAFYAARALLDEEHEPLPPKDIDDNNYFLGKMANHNVVIVFPGSYGIKATAQAARTFPNIRFALMVGIGSGVPNSPNPDPRKDIRLGDVVVGAQLSGLGKATAFFCNCFRMKRGFMLLTANVPAGVIQCYTVRVAGEPNLKVETRAYNPPNVLLKAIRRLKLDHGFGKGRMGADIDQVVNLGVPALEDAGYPGVEHDQLFNPNYQHSAGEDCSSCDVTQIVKRVARKTTRSVVHFGLIASGIVNMGPLIHRDLPGSRKGVSGIDREFSGLLNTFPFLLIKGVCEYGDSHKYNAWRRYAAIAAAAYAKDLLRVIHPQEVELTPLPKTTEPSNASQAIGDTQAMGNGAGAGSSLGADRLQIKTENTQADVKKLRAESI